jgi:hypothetical protein
MQSDAQVGFDYTLKRGRATSLRGVRHALSGASAGGAPGGTTKQ